MLKRVLLFYSNDLIKVVIAKHNTFVYICIGLRGGRQQRMEGRGGNRGEKMGILMTVGLLSNRDILEHEFEKESDEVFGLLQMKVFFQSSPIRIRLVRQSLGVTSTADVST